MNNITNPEEEECNLRTCHHNETETHSTTPLPTPTPTYTLTCPYHSYPNSSFLCDLWCQILAFKSGLCLEENQCPYLLQSSEALLCSLWNEIQLANTTSVGSTQSPEFLSLIGSATAAPNGNIPYADCPYLNDANSFTACSLWCELREEASGELCTDAPVCPYENFPSPYNDELCNLYWELQGITTTQSGATTSVSPITTTTFAPPTEVTCPYLGGLYPEEYCSLWCEIQKIKYNKNCIIPCPYEGMPDESLFCPLWEELQQLSEAAIEAALIDNPTGSYSVGPTPTPTYAVPCQYEDHPTNSSGLCDLWCEVQAYQGGKCVTPEECPYVLQVSEPLLCALWNEIQLANTTGFGSTPSTNFSTLIGSATAAPNGEVPYSECPFLNDPNSVTACLLWCELREVSQGETCSDAPVCPYENSTAPYDSQLCDLWSELEGLKSSGTTNSVDPSENVTCPYLESAEFSTELCSHVYICTANMCTANTDL